MTVVVTQPTVPSSFCTGSATDHLSLLGDDLLCRILTLWVSWWSCFLHCGWFLLYPIVFCGINSQGVTLKCIHSRWQGEIKLCKAVQYNIVGMEGVHLHLMMTPLATWSVLRCVYCS